MNRYYAFSSLAITSLSAALFIGCAAPMSSTRVPEAKSTQAGNLILIDIPAPSLANNVIGDPTKQRIAVYLPPSYEGSHRKYPVTYYLTAVGVTLDSPYGYPAVKTAMDNLLASGQAPEMIMVTVAGFNALGASFYANSAVTGNWEDFVVQDVLGYVDSHYRTLASSASRGISGHSMGGNGALNLAMRHPDVFGAAYLLSPGLFDPHGLDDSQMFASQEVIHHILTGIDPLSNLPQDQAEKQFRSWYAAAGKGEKLTFAYGAAYSPAPDKKPPYILYPYHEIGGQLVRDEAVWRNWERGFGGIAEKISQYKPALVKLKGIGIEYGQQDENAWVPRGCQYLSQQLAAAGIPSTLLTFQGGHFDRLSQRIEGFMLPFLSKELVFEEQ